MLSFHDLFVDVRAACRRDTDATIRRAIERAHMGAPAAATDAGLRADNLRQYRNQVSPSPQHLIDAAFRV